MSYVPPHLRTGLPSPLSLSPRSATQLTTSQPLDNDLSQKTPATSALSDNNPSFSIFTKPTRRTSISLQTRASNAPDPVFQQWKPSERVSLLKPEQIEEVRLRLNVDVTTASDSSPPAPIESFIDMCLHPSIMKDIAFHEYTRPTSIQAQAMPIALSGRDLLGCAETGSGKTAAFTIPMIQHCLAQPPVRRGDGPLALVLAPTRELAQQIEKEGYDFLLKRELYLGVPGQRMSGQHGAVKLQLALVIFVDQVKAFSRSLESFRTAIVVGGTNMAEQRSELRAGVHIVVATPGRFIDHLQQGNSSLFGISFVVLDEADRMLDMGFEPQIREVMQNLPKKHQTLLFSATMPEEIEALAQEYLSQPVQVKVGKVSGPAANVSQVLEKVSESEKIDRLLSLLVEEASQAENLGQALPLTIVFVERKNRCDEVAEALIAQGLHAVSLHGGRSQSEREAALRDFRNGSSNILVATDVASRGLDVTGVAHVVNLDLPKTMEDYVHRIGRTGRAGSTGQATSFYTDNDMILIAHIRKGIADVEFGNTMAFATGKVARRKEREAAAAQREARLGLSKISLTGSPSINVDDRYRYMLTPTTIKIEGAADDAWDN